MAFSARRIIFCFLIVITTTSPLAAQPPSALAERIPAVMSRPEFAHSNFGIEFFDVQTGQVLYALNADKMFVPASTTKLLTEGAVLVKLGGDFRFHTFVYRTGAIDKQGTLKGDLVLVASGDRICRTAFSRTERSHSSITTTLIRDRRWRAIRWPCCGRWPRRFERKAFAPSKGMCTWTRP